MSADNTVRLRPAEKRTAPSSAEPVRDSAAEAAPPARYARQEFLRRAAGLLLAALLLALALWGYAQATHIVTRNALVRSHLSEVGVRGEGVIRELRVAAGDPVRKGDLLALLDDRHLLAQRDEARAALDILTEQIALERASLVFARREAQVTLSQAEAEHRRMQAQAEATRVRAEDAQAFASARERLGDGTVSAEMVRNATARAATQASLAVAAQAAEARARAELDAAQLQIDALALREARLRVMQAQQREAQARLARVEADIDSARVVAPADGAVVRRLAQPGMAVETGSPVVSLWLHEDTWIEAWIPERQLRAVEVGSVVTVSFPSLPGERFTGTVVRVGLATDFEMPLDYLPQTREARMRPTPQVGVRVQLEAPPAVLRPGMSAIVDIARQGA